VARQRDRLARAEARAARRQEQQEQAHRDQEQDAGQPPGTGPPEKKKKKSKPVRNVTDPDSALMPVRGGGLKQGYNCQDAGADDRLMLGGFVSHCPADTVHAARLEQVAARGAQVVTAAHAGPGHDTVSCHTRMCTAGKDERDSPGHDPAACHARMTGAPGTLVLDAGYCSEANLTAGGMDKLIATGSRLTMRKETASPAGPPPQDATATEKMNWKLATTQGRSAYKRRAPDIEGIHASLEDIIGLRRFSMRGLTLVTGEFLLAGLCHNLLLLSRLS
jgi:hypothetical protein